MGSKYRQSNDGNMRRRLADKTETALRKTGEKIEEVVR
jgi:hypothetical protein